LEEEIMRAKFLYVHHRGRKTFQKAWEDNKKDKMEQMNKGHKSPFFRNISQGNPTQNDPRMSKTLGTRPR
jgi:hypothetical protein